MQNVSHEIIKLLNETPNLKTPEIALRAGLTLKQVYYAVSRLRKAGKLKRRNGNRYSVVFELPMTTMPIAVDETTHKNPSVSSEMVHKLTGRLNALQQDYEHLKEENHAMMVNYYDAKAVIKYLESRLDEHTRKES